LRLNDDDKYCHLIDLNNILFMVKGGNSVTTLLRTKAEKLITYRPNHFIVNFTEGKLLKPLYELE